MSGFVLAENVNNSNFSGSSKKPYIEKILGNNIDYTFNEETNEIEISSPYRNLVIKNWEIREQSNGKVIVVGLGTKESEYPLVNLRITDPNSTLITEGVKKAISISIQNLLEASLNRALTLEEKLAVKGSTAEEVMDSLQKVAGDKSFCALVEFYKEENKKPQFSLVQNKTRNISYKESDLDFDKVVKTKMTLFVEEKEDDEEEGVRIVEEPQMLTPSSITSEDDLPF